jgi:8-oxo-dGTP pyrophosphatase MutT (NUDIX family)
MPKIKISYGLAMCRYNEKKNNCVEILLIKKRYSYYFFSFVFGYYKKYDDCYLKYLFNNMSYAEKIDILSMQFGTMWYRIWLNNPEKHFNIKDIYTYFLDKNDKIDEVDNKKYNINDIYKLFFKKKKKFELNFMNDGGKKLRNLIMESTDAEIIWEIPKGGISGKETFMDCAIREFFEETSIPYKYYDIFYHLNPVIETFKDSGIIYKNIFYIASVNKKYSDKLIPKINYRNFNQVSEVEQIKWVSLQEIEFLNLNKKSLKKIINLYKLIIKKFKKANKFVKIH